MSLPSRSARNRPSPRSPSKPRSSDSSSSLCFRYSPRAHALQEARRDELRDHRVPRRAHQRVAVVGAALVARLEHRDVGLRQQRRERHAAADALAERHDVRLDAGELVREQRAGATAAALHFVDDEQQVVLLRQCAQLLHEFARRRDHAAFALDRLEHHGNGLVVDQPLDRIDIVDLGLREARHLRRVDRVPAGLAARRHRRERAAVEAVVERDDLVRAVPELAPPFARELDRTFIRFRAAVREEHLVEHAVLREEAGELRHRLVVERGRRVQQLLGLRLQRLDEAFVAVAEAVDRPALDEIQVALAGVVVEP